MHSLMDKKRLLFLIGFLTLTVMLGAALYFVFFRDTPTTLPPTPPQTGTSTGGAFPDAGVGTPNIPVIDPETGLPVPDAVIPINQLPFQEEPVARVEQVVEQTVVGATLSGNRNLQFYSDRDGKFYRLDANGNAQALSDQIFFDVDTVNWSPNSNEAIIEYPDGANIYFNFDTEKQVTLPKHWEDFSFSDEGDQLVSKSIGLSPENRWLVVSNPDGTGARFVEPLGNNANRVEVDWSPNRQIVATSRTGEQLGADRQEILMVGLNGENFPSITVEGRGLVSEWSPTGDQLLYSVYNARNDFKPELWIVNANPATMGTGRRLLSVDTWADKCAFDSNDARFVYCGVPATLDKGAGFAPEIADFTPDRLFRIDTQTGIQTQIPLDSGIEHTIDDMFVSEDGKTLYFSDKQQDGLFEVTIR